VSLWAKWNHGSRQRRKDRLGRSRSWHPWSTAPS